MVKASKSFLLNELGSVAGFHWTHRDLRNVHASARLVSYLKEAKKRSKIRCRGILGFRFLEDFTLERMVAFPEQIAKCSNQYLQLVDPFQPLQSIW